MDGKPVAGWPGKILTPMARWLSRAVRSRWRRSGQVRISFVGRRKNRKEPKGPDVVWDNRPSEPHLRAATEKGYRSHGEAQQQEHADDTCRQQQSTENKGTVHVRGSGAHAEPAHRLGGG